MSRVNKKGPFGFDCLCLFCQHIMQDCQNKVRKELCQKKKTILKANLRYV